MDDLAQLQTDLDDLQRTRLLGARRVRHGDDEVEFRSDAELVAAIADLERRINVFGGRRVTMVRIHSSKGLGS